MPMPAHWVLHPQPDGSFHWEWVPADQPQAPDGAGGSWHIVSDYPGGPERWEWRPAADAS